MSKTSLHNKKKYFNLYSFSDAFRNVYKWVVGPQNMWANPGKEETTKINMSLFFWFMTVVINTT